MGTRKIRMHNVCEQHGQNTNLIFDEENWYYDDLNFMCKIMKEKREERKGKRLRKILKKCLGTILSGYCWIECKSGLPDPEAFFITHLTNKSVN